MARGSCSLLVVTSIRAIGVDGEKEGVGVITYPDGSVYDGQIDAGKRSGDGKLTMPDGLIYFGMWKGGQIEGTGTLTQPNGDVYEGDLVAGRR